MATESKRAYRTLAEFLDGTGMRQEDLAAKLGVTTAYVSMLVNGHRRPSLTLALEISKLANIPIESLVPERASA